VESEPQRFVEPECLFVEVREEGERLNWDVGAPDRPLEQAQEAFEVARMAMILDYAK